MNFMPDDNKKASKPKSKIQTTKMTETKKPSTAGQPFFEKFSVKTVKSQSSLISSKIKNVLKQKKEDAAPNGGSNDKQK
jgi:hypothetical protein